MVEGPLALRDRLPVLVWAGDITVLWGMAVHSLLGRCVTGP